ncbi:hypothetical protein RNAN_0094 [Rheinheimera nanhaiensis E407-8]|uniref:Uncharacterized protein n=1 Tax=Rheinheimera nanhaiensis E407-8 TaxID=562729 RepID=I1DSV3_9GAMM|nr:hypothetical protein RNAN_0094 [Rheinheimera nanhaiensis E407-8]
MAHISCPCGDSNKAGATQALSNNAATNNKLRRAAAHLFTT